MQIHEEQEDKVKLLKLTVSIPLQLDHFRAV